MAPSGHFHIYPNTQIGNDAQIGDYVEIGVPPGNAKSNSISTSIGEGAVIRSKTIIYAGNKIGKSFTTGHMVMIRENNTIGDSVSIGTQTIIEHSVIIGDRARVHSGAFIPEFTKIEYGAWIGPRVCITNSKYPASKKSKDYLHGVTICRKARIGASVTILPGCTIGEQALVGSGSVVTKDIPAFAVVVGNPARIVGDVRDLRYPDSDKIIPYDVDERDD